MKYTIEVQFKNGQTHSMQANKINFHEGTGGIDIFEDIDAIPVFPGYEEEVKEIKIWINSNIEN